MATEFGVIYPWKDEDLTDAFKAAKMKLWSHPETGFWHWAVDNVWTSDESKPDDPVRKFPAFKYLMELDRIERENKIAVVCKSRRMFVSHVEYAKDLWTFLFVRMSLTLIIGKREEDSIDGLKSRVLPMWRRLDPRFPCHVELRERLHIKESQLTHPQPEFGSRLLCLPSGRDKARQHTATRVHIEEIAFHEKADQKGLMAAVTPAIYGDAGRASIISTPEPMTTFEQLVTKLDVTRPMEHIMHGLNVAYNLQGHAVIFLKYTADPAKRDPEWIAREKKTMTIYDWLKEMELSFDFPAGNPVVPEFSELHTNSYAEHGVIIEGKPIEVGVDFGSLMPAAIFAQRDSVGRLIIHSGLMPENMNVDRFFPLIEQHLGTYYPDMEFNLYCDPAGASKSGQGTVPAAVMLHQYFKKEVKYYKTSPEDRARGIRKLAGQLIGGAPALIVNPLAGEYISPIGERVPGQIAKALSIGWIYDPNKTDSLTPYKDKYFEHLMDAFGYMFIFLYPTMFRDEQTRRKSLKRPKITSHLPRR